MRTRNQSVKEAGEVKHKIAMGIYDLFVLPTSFIECRAPNIISRLIDVYTTAVYLVLEDSLLWGL